MVLNRSFRMASARPHVGAVLIALAIILLFSNVYAETETNTPLKVGVIAPLTGVAADFGQAVRNSIQMALEDNKELSKRATFIFEDVPYDTKQAVSAFQNLARAKKVDLMFIWGVLFCNPIAPLAETMKIPIVVQCVHPEAARDRQYVVRFINVSDQYARASTHWLHQNQLNRIAVVVADNAYTEEMLAALERNLLPGQTVRTVDRVSQTTMDFRAILARIKNSDAQATVVLLSSGQIASFYRQRREQRDTKPTLGANTFGSVSEITAAVGSMEGAVFAANEVREIFISRYAQRYGHASQIGFGALAYEFAQSLAKVLSHGKHLSGVELIEAFEQLPQQDGYASGPYQLLNESLYGRYFNFPIKMQQISGSGFKVLQEGK